MKKMGSRVPVQSYNVRSNSFIDDLNTVDSRPPDNNIQRIDDDDLDVQHSLNNEDDDPNAVDCMHDSYQNSLPLHGLGVEDERSSNGNSDSSRGAYDILTIEDVNPIENARARFLEIIVDHFINHHVIEVGNETDYTTQSNQDKLSKRKTRDVHFEGDPHFALPLMYIANLYEAFVNDANVRLVSLNGAREKTIGVALEAAGGLYRRLAKKFPKKGAYMFRRRELATSLETRTKFPELVVQEEKRVRFIVINGLEIVEKPNNMPLEDAEWFKRLTGRNEVAVYAREYKHYSPRHKFRRVSTNSISNMPSLPTFSEADDSSLASAQGYRSVNEPLSRHSPPKHHIQPPQSQQTLPKHHIQPVTTSQPQYHPIHQSHHQSLHSSRHASHFPHNHQCSSPSHLPEIAHGHQSPNISQQLACLQTLSGSHVTSRLHIMPTSPAKFCDECGFQYLREISKFCSECGSKRLGI